MRTIWMPGSPIVPVPLIIPPSDPDDPGWAQIGGYDCRSRPSNTAGGGSTTIPGAVGRWFINSSGNIYDTTDGIGVPTGQILNRYPTGLNYGDAPFIYQVWDAAGSFASPIEYPKDYLRWTETMLPDGNGKFRSHPIGIKRWFKAYGQVPGGGENQGFTLIVPGSGGTPVAVGITRVSTTMTVNWPGHNLVPYDTVVISGATQSQYNGTWAVDAVTDADNFTIIGVSGSPATPATGSPVAKCPNYANSFKWEFRTQNLVSRNFAQNMNTAELITAGTAHQFKTRMEMNSVADAPDGVLKMWIDGILTHNYSDVVYKTTGNTHNSYLAKLNPTYGGFGPPPTIVGGPWDFLIDDIYLAAA